MISLHKWFAGYSHKVRSFGGATMLLLLMRHLNFDRIHHHIKKIACKAVCSIKDG